MKTVIIIRYPRLLPSSNKHFSSLNDTKKESMLLPIISSSTHRNDVRFVINSRMKACYCGQLVV